MYSAPATVSVTASLKSLSFIQHEQYAVSVQYVTMSKKNGTVVFRMVTASETTSDVGGQCVPGARLILYFEGSSSCPKLFRLFKAFTCRFQSKITTFLVCMTSCSKVCFTLGRTAAGKVQPRTIASSWKLEPRQSDSGSVTRWHTTCLLYTSPSPRD